MRVQAIATPIIQKNDDLWAILDATLPQDIPERTVLAITSKVLSFAEGNLVPAQGVNKHDLVRQTAEWYTEPHSSKYNMMLAIKHHHLFVNAGIDASNADGHFILWPEDLQGWANDIWHWLREHRHLKEVGVIVTDSKTTPLFWGVTGAALSHSGFLALSRKIDQPDLFGRPMEMTQVNVAQALAAAAVYEMGETNECTPIALVSEIRDITFQDRPPSEQELADLVIEMEDDVYAPILQSAPWKPGQNKA